MPGAVLVAQIKVHTAADGWEEIDAVRVTGTPSTNVPPLAPPSPASPPICCEDGCGTASDDGDCDDGGPGSEYSHCIAGTDCTD
eukprot:4850241-Prymnesium_polylepis.1